MNKSMNLINSFHTANMVFLIVFSNLCLKLKISLKTFISLEPELLSFIRKLFSYMIFRIFLYYKIFNLKIKEWNYIL